ncbi:SDR family oxidoreductase [Kibdelosporangium philippinense]|uniref:SDR family oxidoreductase n=1 Tax=Kibdelosporangium philippinense TaxID=211113 RepID=A0ABS8ZAE3_9PSEU|nr:SDR family oxidoreductase [Kibdelosporangium philippinense]MCE7004775.1 SDR family oxidoreductase [Kibdelosporangium philippinense]
MKIVVIGGTGLIGSKLVGRLGDHGHNAVAAAPATGVDTLTGEGLKAALRGADVLVDVSNSPSFADDDVMTFFRTSTGNLIDAAQEEGIGHYVALSVVGSSRHPEIGYFRAKAAQEDLIMASGLHYSIVHATQFFEFAVGIADMSTKDGVVRLPGAGVQPMAADDVAAAVGRAAVGKPLGGRLEIAGPDKFGLDEWVRKVLVARNDSRAVVQDSDARYFGAHMHYDTLLPRQGAQFGVISLGDWLAFDAQVRS